MLRHVCYAVYADFYPTGFWFQIAASWRTQICIGGINAAPAPRYAGAKKVFKKNTELS